MVLSAVSSPICTVDIVRSKLTRPIEFSINVFSSRSSFIKLESALDFTLFHNGSHAEDQNARKSLGSCRIVELPSARDHHTPFAWKVPPNLLGPGQALLNLGLVMESYRSRHSSSPLIFFNVNLNFSTRMIANRLHVEGHLVPHPGNLGHVYHPSAKFEAQLRLKV